MNMSYWVLFIGIAVVSWLVQMNLQSKFKKYSKIPTGNGMTGRDVAIKMLHDNGIYDVQVTHTPGQLTDHYNPTNKTVNLSEDVYGNDSIMAAAVAAHECGHAIQYHENYMPIRVRNAIIPLCNVGNYLGWIAIMIGLALGSTRLAFLGFFLMCGILAFQIITLPVEINASKRGLAILQAQYLNENEYAGAWQMLYAAALTYVAGVCATLASMLRILFMILSSSNRDSN